MNIAILSMQRIKNYGSLLQAYSLRKEIEKLGNKVFFIDIEPNENDNRLMSRDDFLDFKDESSASSQSIVKKANLIRRMIKRKERLSQERVFELFQHSVLNLSHKNNDKKYDCCVIGSDEVFNCLQNSSWGYTSQLFGNVKQADCVLTYAASCGYTNYENVPQLVAESIKTSLNRLIAISVRDNNTFEFVEKISGLKPEIHLDPVAIGNFESEINENNAKKKLPKRYCIYYVYSNRIHDASQIRAIKTFCRNKKLKLVAIGGHHSWIYNHPALNPFEVLWAFKNAEFVITDTFHGALFSIKYAKRFAIYVQKSNANKINDLVSRIGASEHLLTSLNDLDSVYHQIAKRENIDEKLRNERIKSIEYLKTYLKR